MIKRKKSVRDPVEEFIALPKAAKNRIYAEIDAMSEQEIRAKGRPLNAKERAEWNTLQKKMRQEHRRGRGRPKVGKGVAKVSLSIEQSLLDRTDRYATAHKLNRSQVFAQSIVKLLETS
jgi:hypothetical protein